MLWYKTQLCRILGRQVQETGMRTEQMMTEMEFVIQRGLTGFGLALVNQEHAF